MLLIHVSQINLSTVFSTVFRQTGLKWFTVLLWTVILNDAPAEWQCNISEMTGREVGKWWNISNSSRTGNMSLSLIFLNYKVYLIIFSQTSCLTAVNSKLHLSFSMIYICAALFPSVQQQKYIFNSPILPVCHFSFFLITGNSQKTRHHKWQI